MRSYTHILMTLNYASSAAQVISKARELAQVYQAKLSVIHVLDDIAMPDTTYGTCIPLNKATDYAALEVEKKRLIDVATSLGITQSNCWLVWGAPQQEILRLAERQQVDLIVVGAHEQHGLGLLLLHSTADSLLHHAQCDILAVHLEG